MLSRNPTQCGHVLGVILKPTPHSKGARNTRTVFVNITKSYSLRKQSEDLSREKSINEKDRQSGQKGGEKT